MTNYYQKEKVSLTSHSSSQTELEQDTYAIELITTAISLNEKKVRLLE